MTDLGGPQIHTVYEPLATDADVIASSLPTPPPIPSALENLRAEVIDIEALARATEAAADALPVPTTDRQRVVYGRIQSLITKASQQASASLHFANAQLTMLAAQVEARRKASAR